MSAPFELPSRCALQIQEIFDYYENIRGGRPCPSRADFEPSDIPNLLEYVSLIDVCDTTPRFIYRLVGTGVVRLLGKELTGHPVGTGVKTTEIGSVLDRYANVADTMTPFYHLDLLQEENNDYTEVERVMLPLSDDGTTVNMILVLACPRRPGLI